jgi:hypothetical protein
VKSAENYSTLLDVYRRGKLSFLQYVDQTSPYAGAADLPLLDRVRQFARAEAEELEKLSEYLENNRISVPLPGAFPTKFTNYNYVAVRKLLPSLLADEVSGLAALEMDAANLPQGELRSWVEKLAASKRVHVTELEKLMA